MCSKLGQDILTAREREVNVGTSKKQTKLCQNIKDHLNSLWYRYNHDFPDIHTRTLRYVYFFLLCAVLFYKRKANNKVPGQGPRIFGRLG